MATHIIIYHELDKELETQVIGRAQRLGRTNSLNVYYLLNDGEKVNCNNATLSLDIFEDNVNDIFNNHISKFDTLNNFNQDNTIDLDVNTEEEEKIKLELINKELTNKDKKKVVRKRTTKK